MNLGSKSVTLSIVTVTYNSAPEVERMVRSIFDTVKDLDFEILIVDNNSADDTIKRIKEISDQITIISNSSNVGFARANNQAFRIAKGDFILILNPDILLTAQTKLRDLCGRLQDSQHIGIIAPRLCYEDGSEQESVRGFPNLMIQLLRMMKLDRFIRKSKAYKHYMVTDLDRNSENFVDWVIGAFMLIRKEVLFEVGLFDSRYFMYMEDADLCLSLRKKGYKICYSPQFMAVHSYKRESSKRIFSKLKFEHIKSSFKFYLKHGFQFYRY
jgi:hypothetical protein